ncbi:hypothetical protein BDW75DRAFT_243510 [Aspergillus navahoensis]
MADKKRDSTVRFVMQWLNSDPEYLSIDEIEEAHFSAVIMHHHHYANMMGWAGFRISSPRIVTLSSTTPPFPPWDPGNLDLSRLTKPGPAEEEDKIDGVAPFPSTEDQSR